MIVHVHPDSTISLDEPDLFTAFSIRADRLSAGQVLGAFGPGARPGEDDHVWISIARLHTLGAQYGGPDWQKGCDGMIAYAQTKGWVDETGEWVRAHIER